MSTTRTPATPLPALARMAGEDNPFTILGAVVPSGAPMRALLQISADRERLIAALRLAMLHVPSAGKARDTGDALLNELGE